MTEAENRLMMALMRLALFDLESPGLSGPYGATGQDSQVEKNIKKARISSSDLLLTRADKANDAKSS
jgi:hypothetical protein